ncbi:ABC transporter ATP-binding protein [Magnetospirillum sp. 15-1]|uniref:ABC transporter ATP-binding protein n=1 Tax=Magnetospirillum sp. 15-1 TaxID=1979370 RepID=UPI000BBC3A3A|nr:ABC transporter ATP-binding protein [Magnetospirillum sp. 15-1]
MSTDVIEIKNLQVIYGGAIEAVRDVSIRVEPGKIVALLGSNGAGKSTLLKALSGVLDDEDGEIEAGSITHDGIDLTALRPDQIVRRGIVQVPEGRRLFASLTVDENLDMGGYTADRRVIEERRAVVFDLFPRLAERRRQISGYLSGGEQQMVAIGRALMGSPRVLVLDEPSLGLAPIVIEHIYEVIRRLNGDLGLTVLLVEQNAQRALAIADYGYIIERGRIVLDGEARTLEGNADVREFYLGLSGAQRKSLREIKHYKRRKRWLS